MAETKYGKYFFSGLVPGEKDPGRGLALAHLDDKIMKGCHFMAISWLKPMDAATVPPGPRGHAPHIHKYSELLIHLGTNPDDPFDLGAEVELCMGKEMEPHIMTKSTVVYIPANFIHAPWIVRKSWRPWIFIQINQGPMHTEKFYNQLLSKELREQMLPGEDDWF